MPDEVLEGEAQEGFLKKCSLTMHKMMVFVKDNTNDKGVEGLESE